MIYAPDPSIPEYIYDALVGSTKRYAEERSEYEMFNAVGADLSLSVTELPQSPRQILLKRRHFNSIVIYPVKDLWWTMLGSIFHYILENHVPPNWEKEKRISHIIDVDGYNVSVSGQFDAYDPEEETLYDNKFVAGTSMIYEGSKKHYHMQLNCLRALMMKKGYKISSLKNVYGFKYLDAKYKDNEKYPKDNVLMLDVPIMPISDVWKYIRERAGEHLRHQQVEDGDLPHCTDEERWRSSSVFKVYKRKKGKKGELTPFSTRAAFVGETEKEAISFVAQATEEVVVKEMKGEPRKCAMCKCLPFCNQRQAELALTDEIE